MNEQVAILKLLPSSEIMDCINELLQELKARKTFVIDFENPDTYLDHFEYHAAAGWLPWGNSTPPVGDGSDNLYCFFETLEEVPE